MSNISFPVGVAVSILGSLLFGSCVGVASDPMPDPFPETLAWARGPAAESRAFLGLEGRENDSGSLEALSFERGLRVTEVVPGSPAQAAGLRVGDVLLAWEDIPVDDPETLEALLAAVDRSARPVLQVRRADSVFAVSVQLEAKAPDVEGDVPLLWRADPTRSLAGWLTGRGGVVLVTSAADGPFPRAGLPIGSVVLRLDGEPVRSARALIRNLQAREAGSRVEVHYLAPEILGASDPIDAGSRVASSDDILSAEVELFAPRRRLIEASLPVLAGYFSSPDGEQSHGYLLDLYFISLFRYRRDGEEREYRFLRFIRFATGVGELTESRR